jgi:LEA14-like dessication related protein
MKFLSRRLTAAALAGGLLLAGATACGSIQALVAKPEVRAVSITVVRLDLRRVDLAVEVHVANDASAPVTIAGYTYELQVDGHTLVNDVSKTGIELSPKAVTAIRIPLSVGVADLFKKLHAFKQESDLAYRFSATLKVETFLGLRSLSFEKEGHLPLLLR